MRSATRARTSSSWKMARKPVPRALRSAISADDGVAIGGVERGGGLVENEQAMIAGKATRDVDALLLAAGEGRRRQPPQALGQMQTRQQADRALARRLAVEPGFLRRRGDDVERADARDDAQELADVADDAPARVENVLRLGARDVDGPLAVGKEDAPRLDEIIAEGHLEQRGLADPRGAAEHHAFARRHAEGDVLDNGEARSPVQVEREGFRDAFDAEQFVGLKRAHAARTEETRSWV